MFIIVFQAFLKSNISVVGVWDDHDYGINDGGKVWIFLCRVF